jgi:hypothetical protein
LDRTGRTRTTKICNSRQTRILLEIAAGCLAGDAPFRYSQIFLLWGIIFANPSLDTYPLPPSCRSSRFVPSRFEDFEVNGQPAYVSHVRRRLVSYEETSTWRTSAGRGIERLNRILSGQLRSQLVSAAYLWLDMEDGGALYSAASHPPLIRWEQGWNASKAMAS